MRPWPPSRWAAWRLALPVCLAAALGVASRGMAHETRDGLRLAYGADPTYRSIGRLGLVPPGIVHVSLTSLKHPELGRVVGLDVEISLMLPVEWMLKVRTLPYAGLGLLVGDPQRRAGTVGALEPVAGLIVGVYDWFLVTAEGRWFVLSSGGRKHDLGVWTVSLLLPFG